MGFAITGSEGPGVATGTRPARARLRVPAGMVTGVVTLGRGGESRGVNGVRVFDAAASFDHVAVSPAR
ncbi:hypothetical protein ACWGIV_28155 [Streptomyces sp. NPDC054844]